MGSNDYIDWTDSEIDWNSNFIVKPIQCIHVFVKRVYPFIT